MQLQVVKFEYSRSNNPCANYLYSFFYYICHVALPSQAASVIPSSLVTKSVITLSIVVQETLKTHVSLTQSPSVLTEMNSKVTATKLAIPPSPNRITSSLQFSVTLTSYLVNVYRVNLSCACMHVYSAQM